MERGVVDFQPVVMETESHGSVKSLRNQLPVTLKLECVQIANRSNNEDVLLEILELYIQ